MLTPRSFFVFCALATSVFAFAACNGGGTVSAPTPGPTCSPGVQYQMLYPIPGATGVPDNPQQLVFAVSSPLPSTWNAYVNNTNSYSNGAYTIAGMETISASQIPSPSATPNPSIFPTTPYYQSITLASGFASGQIIYVWLNYSNGNCTPAGPVGSFTTQ
ncbi:MAG TPA: hypothetical protein VMD47_00775 [Candidatus Acidoferrales bacterium]|nr:hypothetical protein [Candidatus Acidoferrales bacterium]